MNDTRKRIPYLLDEQPITFYPSLAKALKNPNLAIILQQLHFLLNVAKQNNNQYVFVDNRWWVYNSYAEWQEKEFSWLSQSTIKGLFGMLEEKGIVLSRQGVHNSFDRKKWYTIDYDKFAEILQSIGQNLSDVHETDFSSSDEQDLSDDNKESETSNSESKDNTARTRVGVSNISKMGDKQLSQYYSEHTALIDELLLLTGIDVQFVHWGEMDLTQRRTYIRACETFLSKQIGLLEYIAWLKKDLAWRKPLHVTLKDFTENMPRFRTSINITQPAPKQPTAREKMLHDLQQPTPIVLPLMKEPS